MGGGGETRHKAECSKKQSSKCVIRFVSPFPLHSVPTFSPFVSLFCRAQRPDGVRQQRRRRRRRLAPSVTLQAAAAVTGPAVSALPGVVRRLRRPRKSRHAGEETRVKFILQSVTDMNDPPFYGIPHFLSPNSNRRLYFLIGNSYYMSVIT